MSRRPALWVGVAYVSGILSAGWVSAWTDLRLDLLFLLAGGFLAGAIVWPSLRHVFIWLLLICAGALNITLHSAVISPFDLRTLLGSETVDATVRGRLVATPSLRFYEGRRGQEDRTEARVFITALRRPGEEWQPAFGVMAVSTSGDLPAEFFQGESVEIAGALGPPEPPIVPGTFDYPAYLRRAEIYYQMRSRSAQDWRLVPTSLNANRPATDRFELWARKTLALGLPPDDTQRLLWAMALGWRAGFTPQVSKPFTIAGTVHIFAISGLHIALLAVILVGILRAMRVPRTACGLLVVPALWFYVAVTGWPAPAIRAAVMSSVVLLGWTLQRPADVLNSLCVAGFVILVWQPHELADPGFQLSFFVVFAIALVSPGLDRWRHSVIAPDPLLPDRLRPKWRLRLHAIALFLLSYFTTSVAALLGSLPLVAFYFNLVSPVSLLANIAAVPLTTLILAANVASLATGAWWPGLAATFNSAAWLFMVWVTHVSQWYATLPGGHFWVRSPPVWLLVAYYAVLAAVATGWLRRGADSYKRIATCLAFAVIAIISGVGWWRIHRFTQITAIPLNGGSAVFVDNPKGKFLVDCGRDSIAEDVTIPYLHAQGVGHLKRLVLTHGDIKNVGGALVVRDNCAVDEIDTSPAAFRSSPYRKMLEHLSTETNLVKHAARGDTFGPWTVLHPERTDKFSQADDSAIVLKGEANGVRLLLLSDLGQPGQSALLAREPDLRADIVITGLPDKSEPVCDALLDAARPSVLIVVDSSSPATRRASEALRDRLAKHSFPVLYTRDAGAVTVSISENGYSVIPTRVAKGDGAQKDSDSLQEPGGEAGSYHEKDFD